MFANHHPKHQAFMRGSTTLLFPILLLAALALLTYWVNLNVQPTAPKSDADTRHDPDYFLNHFETTQTDLNGDLRYKLKADQMKHYPDDDSTDLVKPLYTQFDLGKKYVEVEGELGEVSSNGEDIKLYKNVILTRQPYGDKGLMTLESEYLNILPDDDIVKTQKPVVIKQAPKTVVHANSMLYEKKKLLITLTGKVRSHYEKPVAKQK
jgi:lipopolysaccharide export system protein LptC